MNQFRAKRIVKTWRHAVAASAERVFPLLCPVREREWVPGWACEVVHSASAVAEDHCVFRTDLDPGPATWVVTRYEPPNRIGFAVFRPELWVERLDLEVLPERDGGSSVRWTRTYTGLSDDGNRQLAEATGPGLEARMESLRKHLARYAEDAR